MSSPADRKQKRRAERTSAADLLDRLLPADEYLAFVQDIDDPDLVTT